MPTLDMELGGGPWKRKRRANDEVFNRENGASIAPNSPFFDESDAWEEREWTPWIVPMFVAANMALFVPLKQNPLLGPSSSTLEKLGALVWDKVVHQHEGWRLFTGIWLHAGVIHLLPNMLILVFIGIRLEQQFGFVRIGLIYLLSGCGGSILSSLLYGTLFLLVLRELCLVFLEQCYQNLS
ncbi:hypothetical protein HPP92_022369 [Vanilla planifolia]|uniref:RHOMBOID-like protein n=1 Tax=Vanilla planifolia TaxID=51239 RepID=A0A835PWD8_VANPL|nr:hypothetical protein HPP92_022369 [Vanilla planifolia]